MIIRRFIMVLSSVLLFSYNCALANDISKSAWVDIPFISDIAFITLSGGHEAIIQDIKKYHKLEKTSLSNLTKRIELLKNIETDIKEITSKANDANLVKQLSKLANIAHKKAWYLNQLSTLYFNDNHLKIIKIIINTSAECYKTLNLVNKVIYGLNMPGYWGLYWLEVIDPCHRFLTPYYLKWERENNKTPFFLWLETQEIPCCVIQISYLGREEIPNYRISISNIDNLIYDLKGKKTNLCDNQKEYLYVITLSKEIFIAAGSEQIRHTSLTLGEPVLAAGAMKIKDGKLLYIDAESGHYQPTPESLLQAIRILEELKLRIDYTKVCVKYYEDDKTINENLKSFLSKHNDTTPKTKRILSKFTRYNSTEFKF